MKPLISFGVRIVLSTAKWSTSFLNCTRAKRSHRRVRQSLGIDFILTIDLGLHYQIYA